MAGSKERGNTQKKKRNGKYQSKTEAVNGAVSVWANLRNILLSQPNTLHTALESHHCKGEEKGQRERIAIKRGERRVLDWSGKSRGISLPPHSSSALERTWTISGGKRQNAHKGKREINHLVSTGKLNMSASS